MAVGETGEYPRPLSGHQFLFYNFLMLFLFFLISYKNILIFLVEKDYFTIFLWVACGGLKTINNKIIYFFI
jgi:hypothetical protein